MNLRDFRYLVAVADHKHFGKAADACFVSQPALSMQIQKLEDTLAIKLFERTNKQVMVTDVGSNIAERARKIIQDTEEIKEIAKTYQDPLAGEIKLGAFPTLAPYLFPTIVPKISKQLPKLKLLLVEEKTEQLLKKIKQGQIEAVLLTLPIENDGLEVTTLFTDDFLLATHKDHPLSSRSSVTQSDIVNEQLLLLEDGHCLRSQALAVCSQMGVSEQQDFRATSLETLRQMIASGVGITLMPGLAAQKHKDISYIPFKSPTPSRTIALVWRKTSARKECFEKIAELIRK